MRKYFNLKPKNVEAPKIDFLIFKIGPNSLLVSFLAPKESILLSLLCKDYYTRVQQALQGVVVLKDEPKIEYIDFFGLSRNSNLQKLRSLSVNIGGIVGNYYGEH
jgi:hypothetical protein